MKIIQGIRLSYSHDADRGYPYKIFRLVDGTEILWTRIMLRKKALQYAVEEAKKFGVELVVEPGILKKRDKGVI